MIKKILIGAGIVVVAGGLTVGTFALVNHLKPKTVATQQPSTTTSTDKPKTVIDVSKDYGACTLTDTASIKTALGSVADSVQAAQNEGIVKNTYLGDNLKDVASDSQTCVFAFITGGTIENGFNATNGLSITKTKYTNTNGSSALITQTKQDSGYSTVPAISNTAFFNANTSATGPGATYSYDLIVFTSTTESTDYTIRIPADKATLKADAAKAALVSLAQPAKS